MEVNDKMRDELLKFLESIGWTPTKLTMLKGVLGLTPPLNEVAAFLYRCHQWGLDPLDKEQVTLQERKNRQTGEVTYTTIVGVAGRRIIASRTGNYVPGEDTTFTYKEDGSLESATAYVRIYHKESQTWFTVAGTARWDEFAQTYWDKDKKERVLQGLWATKKHVMIAKVAEVIALRRAFPETFSGVYDSAEFDRESLPEGAPDVVRLERKTPSDVAGRALEIARTASGTITIESGDTVNTDTGEIEDAIVEDFGGKEVEGDPDLFGEQ